MLENCKYCGCSGVWKFGVVNGKQRYKCKHCARSQSEIDGREKYSAQERKFAITLYLEGNGFRRIARIMTKTFEKEFRHQTIQYWIKKAGIQVLKQAKERVTSAKMEVLEMDELYTYVKKKT